MKKRLLLAAYFIMAVALTTACGRNGSGGNNHMEAPSVNKPTAETGTAANGAAASAWAPPPNATPADYSETEPRPQAADAAPFLRTLHDRPGLIQHYPSEPGRITNFSDVTLIGNGFMGATLIGGVHDEVIIINEKTVWSGGPGANPNYTGGNHRRTPGETHAALERIRWAIQNEVVRYSGGRIYQLGEDGLPTGAYYHVDGLIAFDADGNVLTDYQTQLQTISNAGWRGPIVLDIENYLFGGRDDFGSYMELGRIHLRSEGDFYNYRRSLNLEAGIASISYTQNGANIHREYFLNHPYNVMGMRVTADRPITQSIHLYSPQPNAQHSVINENTLQMTGWAHGHDRPGDRLYFLKQVRVVPMNGTMRQDGNTLVIENTTEFMLFTVGGTNYYQDRNPKVLDTVPYLQFNFFRNREEAFGEIEARLAFAMDVGYNYLLRTHIQDFNGMMGRLDFRLDTVAGTPPERTTEMLMLNYLSEGPLANTESENRYVEILKFQLGRYLLLSSSREGSLPANLQGVWAAGIHPPWEADYHTNVNLQMNYWLAGSTNLIETQIPLIEWLEAQVARGSFTASWYHARPANRTADGELRPVRGWVLYHINNIWAHTGPENFFEAAFAPNGAAWLATHIWEHFMFTQDIEFLRRYYDVLVEAALFWVDNLWIDTRDGHYVSNPSKSPERGPYTLGSTADMGIIWEILDNAIRANQALGGATWRPNDTEELAEMVATLANLRPPQIGRTGYFMEWRDESWMDQHGRYHYTHSRWGPAAPHINRPPAEHFGWTYAGATTHRHINHLHMLHPGTRIVPGRSPEEDMWAHAMGVTLDTRRHDDANTGWSAAWRLNFNARLHNGDLAYNMLRIGLQQRTFPNLLSFHPPFQIDGNFGTTAGVAEMLMQSHGGWIELIPAIPRDTYWQGGFVRGMLARGNTEVDIRWGEGMLNFAKFRPRLSGELEVSYPNLYGATLTKGGASVPFTLVEGTNRIRFNVVAGEEYLLVTPHGESRGVHFNVLMDVDIAAIARDQEAANFIQLTGMGDEHHNPGLQYIRLGANNYVSHVSTGTWIRWNNIDLRGGVIQLTGDFARGDASMITLALDVRAAPVGGAFEDAITIGQFMTPFDGTGDWYAGREVDGTILDLAEPLTGRHDIFLFMIGTGYNFGGIQLKTLPPE